MDDWGMAFIALLVVILTCLCFFDLLFATAQYVMR